MPSPQASTARLARPRAFDALPAPRWSRALRAPVRTWAAFRPQLSVTALVTLVALYLALALNSSFLRAVADSLPRPFGSQEWRIAGSVVGMLFSLLLLGLLPFATRRLVKPATVVLITLASVCAYFMDNLGVVIDRSMIASALRTDAREAGDLMRGAFWGHVLAFGVLPSVAVLRVRLRPETLRQGLARRSLLLAAVLAAQATLIGLQFGEIVFWGRLNRDVRMWVNPIFPLRALYGELRDRYASDAARPLAPVAADATRALPAGGRRPLQVVLVVGETARAQNFQLNGYARATNPRLSRVEGLVNFGQAVACGTATVNSVPCMFSRLGRQGFSRARANAEENLLDVLARVGVEVRWRNNNTDCQGVCKRVGMRDLSRADDPVLCPDGACLDAILLEDLQQDLPPPGEAGLLVLHSNGSHGPAYFQRYPAAMRTFTPDCRDINVQRCTREEVVNAYDNSLVYTDAFLADLIRRLEADTDRDTVLFYLSDHGENLGENGLFLHGLPYALAPEEQTRVPFLAWLSPGARGALALDSACLAGASDRSASHDQLFHTLLGLFAIRTRDYRADLDLFANCRAMQAQAPGLDVAEARQRAADAGREPARSRAGRAPGGLAHRAHPV